MMSNQSVARPSTRRPMRLRGRLCALAGAAAALALLLTVPTAPASADCGTTGTQGTYDRDSDTFTPGTAATDRDYRITCTESATDGDSVVNLDSLDQSTFSQQFGEGSYLVIDVGGTAPFIEVTDLEILYVVRSSGIETAVPRGNAIGLFTGGDNALWLEFRGALTARGDGEFGVNVYADGAGTATAINRGTINTHGDKDTVGSTTDPNQENRQGCHRPCGRFQRGLCHHDELRSRRDPRPRSGICPCVCRQRRHRNGNQLRDCNCPRRRS